MKRVTLLLPLALIVVLGSGCSAKINGMVKLVDGDATPIGDENVKGMTVNMINTSVPIDQASFSAATNDKGEFTTDGLKLEPGVYKLEVSRIGYKTSTQTIEVGKFSSAKVELFLRRIPTGTRSSLKATSSDADKIINPGEVNIQPPSM